MPKIIPLNTSATEAELIFQAILIAARTLVALLCCGATLSACGINTYSAGSQRAGNSQEIDLQRFLILERPPTITAFKDSEIAQAQQRMARLRPVDMQKREGSRIESANALPWLTGSAIGRKFLEIDKSRVLVRGTPSAFCPVAVVESGVASVPDLAATALRSCLASSTDRCGCQVVAAGSVLLVPQQDVTYATVIAARVRAPSLGLDGFLVAEEDRNGEILLRDLSGVVGRVERDGSDKVEIELEQRDGTFHGRSIKVGFRRGRLAERIYATDDDGNRLTLLIGFDPDELADLAGAWLAWPKG